jgi:perosamine synthetase
VVTDNPELANVLRSMANQGRDDAGTWMNHVRLGYNYRLDEMSAALGLTQISRLDEILARREQVAAWYTERLANVPGIDVPFVAPETTRMSWFVYVIQLVDGIDRDVLIPTLMEGGVPVRPYFVPIHVQPLYRERFGYNGGEFPITEAVARRTLAIPFFTEMSEMQVDYVVDRIGRATGAWR